jgi:hypothetical protein
MRSTTHAEMVPIQSDLIAANHVDSRGMKDPYRFKFTDTFMSKESAPNYYPPVMRKQMKDYMN